MRRVASRCFEALAEKLGFGAWNGASNKPSVDSHSQNGVYRLLVRNLSTDILNRYFVVIDALNVANHLFVELNYLGVVVVE